MEQKNYPRIISEYSIYLQAEKGLAPPTRESYLKAVENFMAIVGKEPSGLLLPPGWDWPEIDKRALEIYLKHLGEKRGWKPGSVRHQASALRAFFRFLHAKGHIGRNPLKSIHPHGPPAPAEPPEGEEEAVRRLFDDPGEGLIQARLLALLELIYGGGMRPSHVYRITDILVGEQGAEVRLLSERKARDVILSEAGRRRVENYLDHRADIKPAAVEAAAVTQTARPFWIGENGRAASGALLGRAVRKAMEGVGLMGGGRLLRQISARHFRERGGDVRSLKQFLGAKRLGTLDQFSSPGYREISEDFQRFHPRWSEEE